MTLTCQRCEGLSVWEHLTGDIYEVEDGWRCVNCGSIISPMILENRKNFRGHETGVHKRRWPKN